MNTEQRYNPHVARQRIAAALPDHLTQRQRQWLAARLEDRIQRWLGTEPDVEPYRELTRGLAAIADNLKKALEKAGGILLRRFDVEKLIEGIKTRNAELGIETDSFGGQPLAGRSAAVDLYLVASRAVDGLRRWNRLYRLSTGAPPISAVQLVHTLKEEYGLGCAALDSESSSPISIITLRNLVRKNPRRYAKGFNTLLTAVQKLPGIPSGLSDHIPAARARAHRK